MGYIQGGNVGNLTIAMTTPVTTLVTSEASGFSLEMCFFLGATKNTWPRPSSASVYLKQEPERQIVTRRLGGYMSTARWIEEEGREAEGPALFDLEPFFPLMHVT